MREPFLENDSTPGEGMAVAISGPGDWPTEWWFNVGAQRAEPFVSFQVMDGCLEKEVHYIDRYGRFMKYQCVANDVVERNPPPARWAPPPDFDQLRQVVKEAMERAIRNESLGLVAPAAATPPECPARRPSRLDQAVAASCIGLGVALAVAWFLARLKGV